MSLDKMGKDELELLSYKDITNLILKEMGPMNTPDLFKKITTLLELPSSSFEKQIGDYYTTLTTDKRFLMLEDGTWDLRSRHTSDKIVMAQDQDEDEDEDELENKEENEDEIDEDDYDSQSNDDDDFDDGDDDLKELVILDEEELELEQ